MVSTCVPAVVSSRFFTCLSQFSFRRVDGVEHGCAGLRAKDFENRFAGFRRVRMVHKFNWEMQPGRGCKNFPEVKPVKPEPQAAHVERAGREPVFMKPNSWERHLVGTAGGRVASVVIEPPDCTRDTRRNLHASW